MPGKAPPVKHLVIGLDAAEKSLLLEWARDGTLPNLSRLLSDGAHGEIKAPPGQYAGSIWPTLHTGCSPARHGRYFHTQLKTGTYDFARFLPPDLKAAPFWEVASRSGRRVAVVDVPKAPVSEHFNGLQLLDWGAHDPEYAYARSWPQTLAHEIESQFGADPVGSCDRCAGGAPGLEGLRDRLLARIQVKTAIIEHVLAQGPWDLVMAVFADSHCAGHQFWRLHDPGHPRHEAELAGRLGNPLKDVYRALDDSIGELTSRAGPAAQVLVFASHGMGPHYDGTFMLRAIIRRLHAGERRSLHVEAAHRLWRRLPMTVRRRSRRTVLGVKQRIDNEESMGRDFFAVPTNDNCGGIRVNLAGRESAGRVRPGREFDELCATIANDLGDIVNLDSGERLVRAVLRTDALFKGPRLADLPDLNVIWNRNTPVRRIHSSKIGLIERDYAGLRSGDHRSRGYFIVRGTGVAPGERPPISAMDLAPSICAWLGVELDADGVSRLPIDGPRL